MGSLIKVASAVIVLIVGWTVLVFAAALGGWFQPPLAARHDPRAFMAVVKRDAQHAAIGNCAVALIEEGRVFDTFTFSIGEPVDGRTLFQMASVSKWVSSWGVMALVEQDKLGLDTPVAKYLTRWSLPPGEFSSDGVTVRRLLSHTAGLTDGLGYRGFAPGSSPQRLEDSLTFASDHMDGADGHVRVGHRPGSRWQYSGGGFTLLQLLVEEVTHDTFAHHMERAVFGPLGMHDVTFDHDRAAAGHIATFYGTDLKPATHYRFTALAAASLYATLTDLSRFSLAHLPGPGGEPAGRGVLRPETLRTMRTPSAQAFGRDIWGLGTMLYARNREGGHVFGHDGRNYPAINHAIRIDPSTRNGIIVLSTGNPRFATKLAADWVFWETGNVDVAVVANGPNRVLLGAGVGVIVLAGVAWQWWRRSRSRGATRSDPT